MTRSAKENLPSVMEEWTVLCEIGLNKAVFPEERTDHVFVPLPSAYAGHFPEEFNYAERTAVFEGRQASESGVIRYIFSHIQ